MTDDKKLSLFASKKIQKGEQLIKLERQYVLSSFEEYYRTYYFTELIKGT